MGDDDRSPPSEVNGQGAQIDLHLQTLPGSHFSLFLTFFYPVFVFLGNLRSPGTPPPFPLPKTALFDLILALLYRPIKSESENYPHINPALSLQ